MAPVNRQVYKTSVPDVVQTVQPKSKTKTQESEGFVKFANQNLHLGPGEILQKISSRKLMFKYCAI